MNCPTRCATRIPCALLLLYFLTGCSGSGSNETPVPDTPATPVMPYADASHCKPAGAVGVWTFPEYRVAVLCTVGQFEWPSAYIPDFDKQLASYAGAGGERFQIGLEYSALTGYNQCAWFMTWLDARVDNDPNLETEAIEYITSVIPNYGTLIPGIPSDLWDPPDRSGFTRDLIEPAQLGDSSRIQEYVRWNCQHQFWLDEP